MRAERAILLAAVVGCGGSDPAPAPGATTSFALAELCARLAEADCARRAECGALAPLDEETCRRRQAGVWCGPVQAALQASVDLGHVAYVEANAAGCAAAIRQRGCGAGFDGNFLAVDECRPVVEPRSGAGDPCQVSPACGAGLFCAVEQRCPGICRAFAQNNEPCDFAAPCGPELYCGLTSMRCRVPAGPGASCESALFGNSCQTGFFCDASQPGRTVCVEVRGRGEGCHSSLQCVAGARCVRNRCSAGLDGDVCEDTSDCQPDLRCLGGACVPPVGPDEACSTSVPCREGLVCTATTGAAAPEVCLPLPTAPSPCGPDDACYLGRCVDGVCVDLAGPGEACAGPDDCLSGFGCDGVCRANAACF